MKPEEPASHYDRIALGWQKQHVHSTYGIAALERAIQFVQDKSSALDIGCGSSGRFIEVFLKHGFTPAGLEEISGGFERERFDYSTLGMNEFLRLLSEFGCTCRHLEYDQYPENHVYIVARKTVKA